jgi:mRNA interferase MazF
MSSMKAAVNPSRGEVWMVSLDPTIGYEQAGIRPALVVSETQFNQSPAGLVVVTPITGTDRGIPAHVRVAPKEGGLTKPSLIMADQVRTISQQRLGRRMGIVAPHTIAQVEYYLRLVLGL